MKSKSNPVSSAHSARWALYALSGAALIGVAGVSRAQAIRPKHAAAAPAVRLAQLPIAGDVVSPADLVAKHAKTGEAISITEGNEKLTLIPAGPTVSLDTPPATGPSTMSLQFKNIAVSELISMIAEQGNVGIIVADDVNTSVKNVNLVDVTAEQAIRNIAETNGYKWRKLDGKTYAIARTMEALPPTDNPIPVIKPELTDRIPQSLLDPEPRRAALELPELYRSERREEPKLYSYLRLRNVTPGLVAWWLDPAHNPVPPQVAAAQGNYQASRNNRWGQSAVDPNEMAALQSGSPLVPTQAPQWSPSGIINRSNGSQFSDIYTQSNAQFGGRTGQRAGQRGGQGAAGGAGGQGIFQLPEGIESLVAIDPQNALLVLGTPDGIQQLEQIIGFLDRPLRQVEIEAQFVTVSTSDARAFGIDFTSSNGPFRLNTTGRAPNPAAGSISIGFVRNNFRATLNALQNQGKSKTVAAPRVTAINNLTASLFSTSATPFILESASSGIGGQVGTQQNLIYITTSVGLSVTPTINNDDTVTVVMQPQVQTQAPPTGELPPAITSQTINTIANVRDGDTIALGGLRTKAITTSSSGVPILRNIPLLGKLFESNNKSELETELIIFLTARIIRRIDDPVPGT
ncbi:MAG TPA: hypothetical protein VF681_06125 [Abditibacteriaceae bacterium]